MSQWTTKRSEWEICSQASTPPILLCLPPPIRRRLDLKPHSTPSTPPPSIPISTWISWYALSSISPPHNCWLKHFQFVDLNSYHAIYISNCYSDLLILSPISKWNLVEFDKRCIALLRAEIAEFEDDVRNFWFGMFQAAKSNVEGILQRHVEMAAEIKNLDTDLQMLVYENYNKFISATDTIKRWVLNADWWIVATIRVNFPYRNADSAFWLFVQDEE